MFLTKREDQGKNALSSAVSLFVKRSVTLVVVVVGHLPPSVCVAPVADSPIVCQREREKERESSSPVDSLVL